MELKDILNLKINNLDFPESMTVKEYLHDLLLSLWVEQEGFSGKRPFGNSGWEYDLYKPLVEAGIIEGRIDEDGYIEDVDDQAGHKIICNLIKYCFS